MCCPALKAGDWLLITLVMLPDEASNSAERAARGRKVDMFVVFGRGVGRREGRDLFETRAWTAVDDGLPFLE